MESWWYATVFATAFALDVAFGEPPARVHPVVWMGKLTQAMTNRLPRRGLGAILGGPSIVAVTVGLSAASGWAAVAATEPWTISGWAVQSAALTTTFSVSLLLAEASGLAALLNDDEITAARLYLPRLCSRSATELQSSDLAAAGVSSVAENFVDSIVAPWFWWLLLGLPGALAYRAINTLDAMIGYRGEYEQLGKAAARLDDAVNWVPARVSGALLAGVGAAAGLRGTGGWGSMLRDHGSTPSPNGGWPMAAMAGLLGVRIEKPGVYILNRHGRSTSPDDLTAACLLVRRAAWTAALIVVLLVTLRSAQ